MAQLLGNRFAPITFSIGYFEATTSELLEVYQRWHADVNFKLPWVITELTGDIASFLLAMEPLTFPATRTLLVETHSSWTAILSNYAGNGRSENVTNYICLRMPRRAVAIDCNEHIENSTAHGQQLNYTHTYFSLYDDYGKQMRSIEVITEDDRWFFYLQGEPLPFEQTEYYAARRVRDRLTPAMLADYCAAVGIAAFDAAFYGPRAILIEERHPWWYFFLTSGVRMPRMSCAEYQQQHGIIAQP